MICASFEDFQKHDTNTEIMSHILPFLLGFPSFQRESRANWTIPAPWPGGGCETARISAQHRSRNCEEMGVAWRVGGIGAHIRPLHGWGPIRISIFCTGHSIGNGKLMACSGKICHSRYAKWINYLTSCVEKWGNSYSYSTAVEILHNSTLNTQVPIPNSLSFCCWISGCNLWAVCHCLSFPHRFHSYFHTLLYIHPSIHPSTNLEIVDDVCAGTYAFLMGILRHPNTGAGSTLGKWFQYQLALCQMIGEEPAQNDVRFQISELCYIKVAFTIS